MGDVSIGIVGLGYWGPNLARNFAALPGARVAWLCDARRRCGSVTRRRSRRRGVTGELDDLLDDGSLDAIVLATPVPTHADLATRVLEAGKHCFVEKPLAQSVADAERAAAAAERSGRVLMVGHLLQYHPA
jgi:predicted dehydrogenase